MNGSGPGKPDKRLVSETGESKAVTCRKADGLPRAPYYQFLWISLPWGRFGIEVMDDCVESVTMAIPPVARWMLGKSWSGEMRDWVESRGRVEAIFAGDPPSC